MILICVCQISIMASKIKTSCDISNSEINSADNMEKFYENYILIDIGAYMAHKKYGKDLENVSRRAKEAGVSRIVVVSMSVNMSKDALRLTRYNPDFMYSTAGVHPHESRSWTEDSYYELQEIAKEPEVVAIGECGLDYNREYSPKDIQRHVLEQQVKLACELKKPLFLHERDAHEDMLTILKKYESELPGGVVHCFTGRISQAQTYLSMGFYIGVTGYLCKDDSSDGIRALLQEGHLPLDRLLVQSDAPYMFPNTQSSKLPTDVKSSITKRSGAFLDRYCTFQRNEPCSLPALVEMVAAFMGKTPEDVALATAFNSLKLFSGLACR